MKKTIFLSSVASIMLMSSSVLASTTEQISNTIKVTQIKALKSNPNFTFQNLKFLKVEEIKDLDSFKRYIFQATLKLKTDGRVINPSYSVFSNGKYTTSKFMDINTGVSLEQAIKNKEQAIIDSKFTLDKKYYKESNLIFGDKNAKNKVLVISDPLCPACIGTVPSVISALSTKKDVALYYYDYPLSIHPAATTISKAIMFLKDKGDKEIVNKVYTAELEKKYPGITRWTNEENILDIFNKVLMKGKKPVTSSDIAPYTEKLKKEMEIGDAVYLTGTPTFIINGKKDSNRQKLRAVLNER